MTTPDERIQAALNDLPTGRPRPIDDIQHRARTLQNRRRATTTGVVLLAAGAVAFPFAAAEIGPAPLDQQPAPAATEPAESQDSTVLCESWEGSTSGRPLDLDEVPDHMRLLWDDSVAEPPSAAYAMDWSDAQTTITNRRPDGCEIRESAELLSLVQTEGDTVVREIRISPPQTINGGLDDLDDKRTIDTDVGPMTVTEQGDGVTAVSWAAEGGQYWFASIVGSMSDAGLVDLAEAVRLVDGEIDVSRWPRYDESWAVARSAADGAVDDELTFRLEGPFSFSVHEVSGTVDLGEHAMVGDEHVDINGQQGLLSDEAGRLEFVTEDDARVVIVSHFLTSEELLAVARSIEPVPADDPRLADVWQTEFGQQSD